MADGKELKDNLGDSKQILSDIRAEGAELRILFKEIGDALAKGAGSMGDLEQAAKVAASDTKALATEAKKLQGVTQDDLKDKNKAAQLNKAAQSTRRKIATIDATITALQKKRVTATEEEAAKIDEMMEDLMNGKESAQEMLGSFDQLVEANNKLNDKTKFFEGMADTLKTIPGIGPAISGPFTKAAKAAREARVEGGGFVKATAAAGGQLMDAFGPGALLGMIIKGNTAATEFNRTLGLSREAATDMRVEMAQFSASSERSYATLTKLRAAQSGLTEALGVSNKFSNEILEDQVMLTKKLGLSTEEAAEFAKVTTLTGKSTTDITEGILDSVVAEQRLTGIRVDGRKVVKEVAQINGQLGAQYGFNTKRLAEAVIAAQKLGVSLKDAADISRNLLDFSSSIEAEMEAELLTGRQINLETARRLALQGKSAEALTEIADQMGSAQEFSELNVIQQESLAKAAGMTADQLANMLRERETLSTLGAESIEQLKEEGRLEELKTTETGKQMLAAYEQSAAAEKLQDTMAKLGDLLGEMMDGAFGNFVQGFASILSSSEGIYATMGLLSTLMIGNIAKMIIGLGTQLSIQKLLTKESKKEAAADAISAGSEAASSVSKIPIVGGFLAIGLAAGLIGFLLGKLTQANDLFSPGKGMGGGFGDRMLLGPEGAFALNNRDTVLAGTDLMGGGGNNNANQQTMGVLESINSTLASMNNRPEPTINVDSVEMGSAVGLNAFPLQ